MKKPTKKISAKKSTQTKAKPTTGAGVGDGGIGNPKRGGSGLERDVKSKRNIPRKKKTAPEILPPSSGDKLACDALAEKASATIESTFDLMLAQVKERANQWSKDQKARCKKIFKSRGIKTDAKHGEGSSVDIDGVDKLRKMMAKGGSPFSRHSHFHQNYLKYIREIERECEMRGLSIHDFAPEEILRKVAILQWHDSDVAKLNTHSLDDARSVRMTQSPSKKENAIKVNQTMANQMDRLCLVLRGETPAESAQEKALFRLAEKQKPDSHLHKTKINAWCAELRRIGFKQKFSSKKAAEKLILAASQNKDFHAPEA